MLKKGYLEHTKDKSVTEVTKKIVTEMMPDKEKEYNRNQYIQSLQHRRRKITFEVPDALLSLPTNILKETVLEKKKAESIGVEMIEVLDDHIFKVKSTTTQKQHRIVDMLVGNCSCDIAKSKRIICRHLWAVEDHYGDEFQYTVDSFNKKLFIETHQLQIQSTNETKSTANASTSSNSNSSDNSVSNSSNSNANSTSNQQNNLNLADSDPIPIPVTQSHKNKQSALTLLSTLKTI